MSTKFHANPSDLWRSKHLTKTSNVSFMLELKEQEQGFTKAIRMHHQGTMAVQNFKEIHSITIEIFPYRPK